MKRPIIKLFLLPINSPETSEQEHKTEEKQTEDSQEENKTRKRAPPVRLGHVNLISLALALTLFMSIAINTAHGMMYNITKLRKNQSLYFDPVAKMNLIRDKWTLVVYYDMSPYWEGTIALEKLLTHLDNTCTNINSGVCNMIVPQLQHEFLELRSRIPDSVAGLSMG